MRQRWESLAFLHWSVAPSDIAALLPPGLELDLWQGRAYLGIVPFTVRAARPSFLPPLPVLSSFHELNVRTYVHRRGSSPGVWFFSLDAASRAAVWGARAWYKLPYFHASMALVRNMEGVRSFSSRRSEAGGAHFTCTYAPASVPAPAATGTLEFFLIERYLLYSWDGRRLRSARVWHRPYGVSSARIADLSENVTAAAKIDVASEIEPIAHYSDAVDVRIYSPTLVTEAESNAPFEPSLPELIQPSPAL
jgi:uncharacterized protein YqjF (DUF2071 family)